MRPAVISGSEGVAVSQIRKSYPAPPDIVLSMQGAGKPVCRLLVIGFVIPLRPSVAPARKAPIVVFSESSFSRRLADASVVNL